jgi:hypothetical protein
LLFASDEAASWPAVASIPVTFFAVLALVLWEARREVRESESRVPEPQAAPE